MKNDVLTDLITLIKQRKFKTVITGHMLPSLQDWQTLITSTRTKTPPGVLQFADLFRFFIWQCLELGQTNYGEIPLKIQASIIKKVKCQKIQMKIKFGKKLKV